MRMMMMGDSEIGFQGKQNKNRKLPLLLSFVCRPLRHWPPNSVSPGVLPMDCPPPLLTRRKVPSSPREFFAKIYESSSQSLEDNNGMSTTKVSPLTVLEEGDHPPGVRLDSFLWTPSIAAAAAAAQFHWNLVYNLSSSGSKVTPRDEIQQPEMDSSGFQEISAEGTLPHFQIPPALNSFLARKRRRDGRVRRQRTTFSSDQTVSLEIEFQRTEYISRSRRCELAQRLSLSETQIKIWFQNRRAKDKRLEKAQADQQVFSLLNCYQTT